MVLVFCLLFCKSIDLFMIFLVLIEERRLEDNHGLIFSFLSLLVADLRVARLFTTPVKESRNCSK